MLTVSEFLYLCIDPSWLTVKLYDCEESKEVYVGDYDSIPDELLERDVQSWDVPTEDATITINI